MAVLKGDPGEIPADLMGAERPDLEAMGNDVIITFAAGSVLQGERCPGVFKDELMVWGSRNPRG